MENEKEFIDYVLKFIKDEFNLTLPNFGCIAGQAIAQLYFDFYNIDIQTRIKDIDLFLFQEQSIDTDFLKQHIPQDFFKNNFKLEKTVIESNPIKIQANDNSHLTSFDSLDVDEEVTLFESLRTRIKVINSCNSIFNDLLNITFYSISKHTKSKESLTYYLISGFDFNSVQIGICLKSKKLYMTEDFKDFIKNRYVSMNLNNFRPSTVIRYFDKYGYYKNCIFNPEQELKRVYFHTFFQKYKERDFHKKTFLRERVNKLSEKSKSACIKYIHLKEHSFATENKTIETYQFRLKNLKYLTEFKSNLKYFKDIPMFLSYKNKEAVCNFLNSRKKVVKLLGYSKNKDLLKHLIFVLSMNYSNFNDQSFINVKKVDLITLCKHPILFKQVVKYYGVINKNNQYKDIKEYIHFISNKIKDYERNNLNYLIGLFESGRLPIEFILKSNESLIKIIENSSYYGEKSKIIIDKNELNFQNTSIKQLTTRIDLIREGQEMKHCIGGYNFYNGNIHFSLLNKNNNERSTFTFYFDKSLNCYKVREVRNKYNGKTSKQNLDIVEQLLLRLNKNESFIEETINIVSKNTTNVDLFAIFR